MFNDNIYMLKIELILKFKTIENDYSELFEFINVIS